MKRENDQKIMGRNAKCIRHKNLRDPIVQATATNSHSEVYEYLQEDTMVVTIAKSNFNRQQRNDTPFMTLPLVDIFGYLANDKPAMEVINGTFVPPDSTPQYMLEFLEVLKMLDAIRALGPVDLSITSEETV